MKHIPPTNLIEERKRRQWSQQEMADLLGTTQHTVSRWERGASAPGPYFRTKLCALFGKTAQELGLLQEKFPGSVPSGADTPEAEYTRAEDDEFVLWMVPYPRNPHFTGREELLDQLTRQFSPPESDHATLRSIALTQTQIIKGLGGIGKTQTAIEYAYRARAQGRFTHTLWISAASEETITTSILTLAALLPDVATQDERDQQKLLQTVKQWLEQCKDSWLLIVDNADDLSLVQPYLPVRGNGCLLFTTRANAVGTFASSLEVETMGVMEGTLLLLRRAHRFEEASDAVINEASSISVELGQFPLALDQAGAYIDETGCSVSDYLALYREHRHRLLARRGQQMTGYPESVATTWALSFERIAQIDPACTELLQLCALLAPDHIPEELLLQGTEHWPSALHNATTDLFRLNQLLEPLLAFSLIKRLSKDHSLSIHRLVQAVQLERMPLPEQRQWTRRLVLALHTVFPRNPKETTSWSQCTRYLEQVQTCDLLVRQHQILLPEAAQVFNRTGQYLSEHAVYAPAELLYQHALSLLEQCEEAGSDQIIWTQRYLADLYAGQDKFEQAEKLYRQALQTLEQQKDTDPLQIASLLRSLANVSNNQARYGEAEQFYQRVLRMYEQMGVESTDVSDVLSGLSWVYVQQGKYEQAEQCSRRALFIREQISGPEHLAVAFPLIGLAAVFTQQGRFEQAEPLYQRALRVREQYLGPEHPHVAYVLHDFARLRSEQGQYEEAELLYQRALRIREQSLGPESRVVSDSVLGLANLSFSQGRFEQAESLYQRALRIREQRLGPANPDVALPLLGLANLYFSQERYREAEPLYQRTLSIYEQDSLPRNAEVAGVLNHLTRIQQAQKQSCHQA